MKRTTSSKRASASRKSTPACWHGSLSDPTDADVLKKDIIRHVVSSLGHDYTRKNPYNYFWGLALAVRDRLIDRWIKTQHGYYEQREKRVYYLSLEYLPGKALMNNLHCLGLVDCANKALEELGFSLEDLAEIEEDAGLGNGGLGRLASCYLDSMATLGIPGYGYGIRYDYGIFHQAIENGLQVERCDNWLRYGTPWEYARRQYLYEIMFGGRVHEYVDGAGRLRHRWEPDDVVMAMACDMHVPGFGGKSVINMRLWAAKSDREFDLSFFNSGDYIGAVSEKIKDENISKVLYPSENVTGGRRLRLKQQYFFVAATLQDIMRRHKKHHRGFENLPETVSIQLNDTHPAIAIPEMMRILVDEELLDWDEAWDISCRIFSYTNHTILPEALETWPVEMLGSLLPRHLQIIYEINRRFLDTLQHDAIAPMLTPEQREQRIRDLSLIGGHQNIRMANLAIVGSHTVNGVSELHSQILRERVFRDFDAVFPGKMINVTNGVTPRRWLNQCNPDMAALLSEVIGPDWICDLNSLKALIPLAEDPAFRERWRQVRMKNKQRLARYVLKELGFSLDLNSMIDVQVKRMHEYKRQLLNALHVIHLYHRLLGERNGIVPRTVIFAGKSAPGYFMAKLIIRLITALAKVINNDTRVNRRLNVLFLPNYRVSQAEIIVPATDLSEQISMAGMEASGTGNMKFGLNGALTIGTLDGANIEMLEEIGQENMFIFGHTAEQINHLKQHGYDSQAWYRDNPELKTVIDMIAHDTFSPDEPGLFRPITDSLLAGGDPYCVLADFSQYIRCQQRVSDLFRDQDEWLRRSILNTANMGKFSSDRSVLEYADRIWGLEVP